jgi:hypothetical protein
VAVGSLLLGLSRAGLGLIYVSIGASILAMGFVLAAVLRRPGARGSHPEATTPLPGP